MNMHENKNKKVEQEIYIYNMSDEEMDRIIKEIGEKMKGVKTIETNK